jgi:PAS domain S-box-containing protein
MGRHQTLDAGVAARTGKSLRVVVATRLAGILIVVFVVIAAGVTLTLHNLNKSIAERKINDAVGNSRARIVEIDASWRIEADALRSQLEFSRVLDAADARILRARFIAFVTSIGGSGMFTHVVLIGPGDTVLANYRTRSQQDLQLPAPLDATPSWIYGAQDRTLYRALSVPVLINGRRGRLIVYAPLDNALLSRNVSPDTRIHLLWQGQVVAESVSTGRDLAPARELNVTRNIAWVEAGPGPELQIQARVAVPVSAGDVLLIVFTTVCMIAVLGWLVLGRWLTAHSRRVKALETATGLFSKDQLVTGDVRRELDRAYDGKPDEIGILAHGMVDMMLALGHEKKRLATILRTASDGIHILNRDGLLIEANEAFLKLIGYERDAISRLHVNDWDAQDPLSVILERNLALMNEQATVVFETRHRRRDGVILDVEISACGIEIDREHFLYASSRDISARKLAEKKLAEMNAELETRVAARTAELDAANNEMASFSYTIAHDLRAPVRAINGFSELVLEANEKKLDQESIKYMRRIQGSSLHMGELIDDLLDLARLSRQEMRRADFNISRLASAVATSLRQSDPDRKVEFVIQPDLVANGDSGLIRAVLDNLLGNAWKYTGKVGAARIEFGTTLRDGQAVYFVGDNGTGFDMQYAYKLFAPFQRLHRASEFEGTGIGLATVKKIIDRHGGTIAIESALNAGTTVYFTFGDPA